MNELPILMLVPLLSVDGCDKADESAAQRAANKEGLGIGRSVVDVAFEADDAKYVSFEFDAEIDTQPADRCAYPIAASPPSASRHLRVAWAKSRLAWQPGR